MVKVDAVIPTKGEWTLPHCIKAARKVIPINNLILVTTSAFADRAEKLADTCVIFDEKNIGKARAREWYEKGFKCAALKPCYERLCWFGCS